MGLVACVLCGRKEKVLYDKSSDDTVSITSITRRTGFFFCSAAIIPDWRLSLSFTTKIIIGPVKYHVLVVCCQAHHSSLPESVCYLFLPLNYNSCLQNHLKFVLPRRCCIDFTIIKKKKRKRICQLIDQFLVNTQEAAINSQFN